MAGLPKSKLRKPGYRGWKGNPVFALREGAKYEEPKRSDIDRIDYRYGHHRHRGYIACPCHWRLDPEFPLTERNTGYRFHNENSSDAGYFNQYGPPGFVYYWQPK